MEYGISIDTEKCTYCFDCVEACRGDCLSEFDGEIYIDNSECQLCESCLGFCDAMTLTLRNGMQMKSSGRWSMELLMLNLETLKRCQYGSNRLTYQELLICGVEISLLELLLECMHNKNKYDEIMDLINQKMEKMSL